MAKIISISKAKQSLLELARRTKELGESYIIVRDSEPISALIPIDEYEAMLETLDILEEDPQIKDKLLKTEKEIAAGKYVIWKSPKGGHKKPTTAKTSQRKKKVA